MFVEISQNSQENTSARVNSCQGLLRPQASNFINKEAQVFPVNFPKFLSTPFLRNTSGDLLCYGYTRKTLLEFQYHTGIFRTLSNIYDGEFCENSQLSKAIAIFAKLTLDMF